MLPKGPAAPRERFRRGAPDCHLALPMDRAVRLRRTSDRTGDRRPILQDGRKFYRFKKTPYMPVEFSAAAYRLGHSMVRQTYSHNRGLHGYRLRPAVRLHRPVRPDHRRPRAEPAGRTAPGFQAAEQLDHRLAPVLRSRHPVGNAELALNPTRKIDPLLARSCTSSPAEVEIWPPATSSAA